MLSQYSPRECSEIMAVIFSQLLQRKWLLCINGIVGFSFLFYLVGYQPPNQLLRSIRFTEDSSATTSEGKAIIPCIPKRNIVFLKTHKCASSSVQNILLRRAHRKNLTLVLPVSNTLYLSFNRPFSRSMIAGAPWANLGYNIICHHMVFGQSEIEKLMPRDSTYISIVRNPVSLFESMYEYDKLENFYKMNIEEYAHATRNASSNSIVWKRRNVVGRNPMLYDFGTNPKYHNNSNYVKKTIRRLDKRFDLVMIAEHFDESMVILRHLLCWELDDIISLAVNARMDSYRKNLSDEAVKDLQNWLWADQMLYSHFAAKFDKIVDEFGRERMAREVKELQEKRQEWFDYCVEETVLSKNFTSYKIWSPKVVAFKRKPNVTDEMCEDLVKPENFFTNEIRQLQILRALDKGATRSLALYRMINPSNLEGAERATALRYLKQFKHRKIKDFMSKRKG